MSPSPAYQYDLSQCPNGGVFYSCNNGFQGCCLVGPCDNSSGCPEGMERSQEPKNRVSSSDIATPTLKPTTPRTTTTTIDPTTTTSPSIPVASGSGMSELTSMTNTAPDRTVYMTLTQDQTTSPRPSQDTDASFQHDASHSTPTIAIVAGTLGGVILVAIVILALLCLRRHRRRKMYTSPAYPSPYIGSDMSQQLQSKCSKHQFEKVELLTDDGSEMAICV